MIIKPAISWLNTDSDVLFINDTKVVLLGLGNNTDIYTDPCPRWRSSQTALDKF